MHHAVMPEKPTTHDTVAPSALLCRRIGRRLRHIRKLRGLTLRELAARSGLTEQRLSRSERGLLCGDKQHHLKVEELFRLSDPLAVSITVFFDETSPVDDTIRFLDAHPDVDREALRLIRAFNGIRNRKVRRTLFDLIAATGRGYGPS
jgi:transcriptional regulator with XRE-family HTH domain